MENLGKRFHVNFLGYAHWFMSIRISKMRDNYTSVDQARYATSIVAKYLDTVIVKINTKCIRPLFHLILYSPRMMYLLVMRKFRS